MAESQTEADFLYAQLQGFLAGRAAMWGALLDELTMEIGESRAVDLLKRVLFARGQAFGARFASHAPGDIAGLRDAYLASFPRGGEMFQLAAEQTGDGEVEFRFADCPQKELWLNQGLPAERIATLCSIAGEFDRGTFDGAGFDANVATWTEGRAGCCHVLVRTRERSQRPPP